MFILKCEAFDDEASVRYSNKCCVGCHENNALIPVTPYAIDATLQNHRLDWEIGIQAMVCCGRFEFVRSLSREWWVKKGESIGLWTREQVERLMHRGSWHPTYDDSRVGRSELAIARAVGVSAGAIKKVKTGAGKCPACGTKWSGEVCDNCGYGAGI